MHADVTLHGDNRVYVIDGVADLRSAAEVPV